MNESTSLVTIARDLRNSARIPMGDFRAMARYQTVITELRTRGRIPIALVDMTPSMNDDIPKVKPIVDGLQKLGVPVFSFGDATVGESVISLGVDEARDGAGNGAETPFACLSAALMYLGRPLTGLEYKEGIVKTLYGPPDDHGIYHLLYNGRVRGEQVVADDNFCAANRSLSFMTQKAFDEDGKIKSDPTIKAVKELVTIGMPLDVILITDEFAEAEMERGLMARLRPLIEVRGDSFDVFLRQYEKTRQSSKFPWFTTLESELKKNKINLITITPESNFLDDYGEKGLKNLYLYWQAVAQLVGGMAIKLDDMDGFKVEALIEALKFAQKSVARIGEISLPLLTVGTDSI